MTEEALQAIYNYRRLANDLATSGQPTEAQLRDVARAGFGVVINLALHDGKNALPDERGTVEGLGMIYEHIPVIWERPTHENLEQFFLAMERHAQRRRYVHCAANMRVSAFMALYRVLRLGWRLEDAMRDVRAIWEPNDTWRAFMEAVLASRQGRDGEAGALPAVGG